MSWFQALLMSGTGLNPGGGIDYYVAAAGTGSGLSAATPMSLADFLLVPQSAFDRAFFKRGDVFIFPEYIVTVNNLSFLPYGSGADPKFYGSDTLSGATWTSETGGYYSTPLATAPLWVFNPAGEAARQGESDWIPITSTPTTTSRGANTAALNAFNSVQSLVGAKMRIKEFVFRMSYEHNISAYNSGTGVITTTETFSGADVGLPFKLYGQKQFATLEGDWWYDDANDKLWIKTASDPTGLDWRVCTKNQAFFFNEADNCTVDNIEFSQYYRAGLESYRSDNLALTNINVHDTRTNGLWIYGNSTGLNVSGLTVTRAGCNAVMIGAIHTASFTDIDISEIGEQLNMPWPIDAAFRKHSGAGISVSDEAGETPTLPSVITVSSYIIHDVGGQGIAPYGDNWIIEDGEIYNWSSRFTDVGGIHTFYSNALGAGQSTSDGVIQNAHVHDGIGNTDGVVGLSESLINGIYIDNGSNNWTIDNCSLYNNPTAGIFTNWNSEQTIITGCNFWNNALSTVYASVVFREIGDSGNSPNFLLNRKNQIHDCTFLLETDAEFAIVSVSTTDASYNPYADGGSADNNFYIKPYRQINASNVGIFRYGSGFASTVNVGLTAWQSRNSVDAASIERSYYFDRTTPTAGEAEILKFTNTTTSPVLHDFTDGIYEIPDGTDVNDVTVPARSSAVVLLKTSYYYLMDRFLDPNNTTIVGKVPLIGNTANVISGAHVSFNQFMASNTDGNVSWNVGQANHIFEILAQVTNTATVLRMDVRLQDNTVSANNRIILDFTGGNIRLREFFSSATATQTWTTAFTLTNNAFYKIRIHSEGSNIKVYVAGVLYFDVTTSLLTGNWVNIFGQVSRRTYNIVVYPNP